MSEQRLIDMTDIQLRELVRESVRQEMGATKATEALESYRSLIAVAEHFDVSTQHVRKWIRQGCPAYNLRGAAGWRLRISDVEAWLAAQAQEKAG